VNQRKKVKKIKKSNMILISFRIKVRMINLRIPIICKILIQKRREKLRKKRGVANSRMPTDYKLNTRKD